ncbi:hypothetical protein ACM26V_12445 [Salipaludibacillus sp. HK11]|uniref:hypothetical protein n=1 Tax=Salipaludibacillus sp. HK11 TaxID=3394320 RepID=UPI0039FCE2B0
MLKKHYKLIFSGTVIIILLFVINQQHQEKKLYEQYISQNMNYEIKKLVKGIVESYNIFDEILDSGDITNRQAKLLISFSKDIVNMTEELERKAISLERLNHSEFNNVTYGNTLRIFSFFSNLDADKYYDIGKLDDIHTTLDSSLYEKIKFLKELYFLWILVVEDSLIGVIITEEDIQLSVSEYNSNFDSDSVSNNFWIDLLVEFDEKTNAFLNKYEIDNIKEKLN